VCVFRSAEVAQQSVVRTEHVMPPQKSNSSVLNLQHNSVVVIIRCIIQLQLFIYTLMGQQLLLSCRMSLQILKNLL